MSKVAHLDESNFDAKTSQGISLVDFWAPWCGPCKAVAPILDELANDYKDKIVIAKLNVDESPQNASKYGVSAIPTMLIFKKGEPVHSMVGYKPKTELKKAIDEAFRAFTRAYGDSIEGFFAPLKAFLVFSDRLMTQTPWPIVTLVILGVAWQASRSLKVVAYCFVTLMLIGYFGMWEDTMRTVAMIFVCWIFLPWW